MINVRNNPTVLLILLLLIAVAAFSENLVDSKATVETKALFSNLKKLENNHILVGQHDATLYGHSWAGDDNRSDIQDVCGSHPA